MTKPRKLSSNYECPIDNLVYIIVENIEIFFYKNNFTPNQITTLALITGILSPVMLYHNHNFVSIFLFFISYVLDCLDGYYARKYDMVTKFGDYYDHLSDILKNILILLVIFIKNKELFNKYIYLLVIIIITMLFQFGNQECLYNTDETPSLKILKKICNTKYMKITRYFGSGTYYLFILFLIYNT